MWRRQHATGELEIRRRMLLLMDGTGLPCESAYQLEHVSDAELLAGTRRLVGRSNQVLAELLAHLAEVEARGIHRARACPSLYMYCVYELRLSEDAAFRRARVARVARQFPVIFQQVADGELHLTALVLLAPHLTEENHRELLALAKHRTKREILHIVRTLAPSPVSRTASSHWVQNTLAFPSLVRLPGVGWSSHSRRVFANFLRETDRRIGSTAPAQLLNQSAANSRAEAPGPWVSIANRWLFQVSATRSSSRVRKNTSTC